MVVRAATDKPVAIALHAFGHRTRIFYNLLLVSLESRLKRFVKADCFGRNDVHQRSTLDSGKSLGINFFGKLFSAENKTAAGTTQCLVCRCCDKICVLHWTGMQA